jgi:hypothetical protein
LSTTLGKIWLLDRFFTVLPITLSFLVRFRLVKYQIEALNVLHTLVKGWSVRFSFWSGQRSGQTLVNLGQPWSNLVKLGQNSPNSGKRILGRVSRVFEHSGPQSGQKRSGQTSVKLSQLRSNLVNLGQTWSDLGKCVPDPVLRLFGVMSPRRIRPTWFGLPRFACRHSRKSRG